jgi:hypothetical protein
MFWFVDDVFRNFYRRNPSGRTVFLWSTEGVTEMGTGMFCLGEGGRGLRLMNLVHSGDEFFEKYSTENVGNLRACLESYSD